ncbi:methylenetetrahydrofolate reductase [Apilactobacillus xinyiensis]|uniref:methylenetetrahydrofolate reductase n=1 Tax=Apilactobacillus xinyiensis TaxID=2841032 RepID=UPI001C7D968B|nr:methylenetetrahydrofolate reductase [Apilactobacillus xinyiensis]
MSNKMFSIEISAELNQIQLIKHYLKKWRPSFVSINNLSETRFEDIVQITNYIKKDLKIPVLVHMSAISKTKDEIITELKTLESYGIHRILALQGNLYHGINIKNDFHYASDLVKFINDYDKSIEIFGTCYPEKHPEAKDLKSDIEHLKIKVNAGAIGLISQICFDNEKVYQFIQKIRKQDINVPVFSGIMPVTKDYQLHWLDHNMISTHGKFDNVNELDQYGVNFSVNQINDLLKHNVDGIHLYTMNDWQTTDAIYDKIKHNFQKKESF